MGKPAKIMAEKKDTSNGVYFYGVCSSVKTKKLSAKDSGAGIGGGPVFFIPYQDVEAVVSEVSLEEFGSEEIQSRAVEDWKWIKDQALTHERVIETVMNSCGLIIPMKFGTIFKDRKSLTGSLKKDYLKLKNLLASLIGKEERSVKIYSKRQLLADEIKKKSPLIQSKLAEMRSLPAGRQYFLEEEVNDLIKKEVSNSINNNYIPLFLAKLKGIAEEARENKILGEELTQRKDPMVFNGAFLVTKEQADRFRGEIEKLQAEYEPIGFTFESSGPWPPYNFV